MVDIVQVVVMVGGGVEKKNRTKKMMSNYEKKNEKIASWEEVKQTCIVYPQPVIKKKIERKGAH